MAAPAEAHLTEDSAVNDPATSWMWTIFVVAGLAATTGFGVGYGEPGWRWAVLPLMALLLAAYFALGRRVLQDQDGLYGSGTAMLFVGLVFACALPVMTISPTASMGLFVIAPLVYMTGGIAAGTTTIGGLLVVPDLIRASLGLLVWSDLAWSLGAYVIILGFSHWFGTWITRVVVESEERAALIAELRRSQAEVARLSQQAGALAEREHLAREIHDTLAQGFTSIITLAQAVESELDSDPAAARRHVALARETAQENLAEARALVAARSPVSLDQDSLEGSLGRLVARLGQELGIEAETTVLGEAEALPPPVQVGLVRIAQEALANIRKHAGATRAHVTLEHAGGTLRLTVEDDGRGFAAAQEFNGHGLGNLRHRAEALGGQCRVDSAPGEGTRVCIEVPVPHAEEVQL